LNIGDKCELGSQLRPNIVWFGEAVPAMEEAVMLAVQADIFVVIGTSMVVYPAASLIDYIPDNCPVFVIDPKKPEMDLEGRNITFIEEVGSVGVAKLKEILLS
jgi:NAD-dependent deacetylase